jgi:hypothetical protein
MEYNLKENRLVLFLLSIVGINNGQEHLTIEKIKQALGFEAKISIEKKD